MTISVGVYGAAGGDVANFLQTKKAFECSKAFRIKDRQRLTLPGIIQVPSALTGLTSLFGMGRGDPRRYSHLKIMDQSILTDRNIFDT